MISKTIVNKYSTSRIVDVEAAAEKDEDEEELFVRA